MARSAQIQLLLISVLTARAALGQRPPQGPQNSDLSILGGPVIATQAIADANVPVHFNGVFSLQSNFAHTIHSYSFADLWLEFPSTSTFRGNDEVGGGIKSASFDATFGTPGVRLHVPVGRRGCHSTGQWELDMEGSTTTRPARTGIPSNPKRHTTEFSTSAAGWISG